jgi:phage terminase large subunit-like protein
VLTSHGADLVIIDDRVGPTMDYRELKRAVRDQAERVWPSNKLIEDKVSGTDLIQGVRSGICCRIDRSHTRIPHRRASKGGVGEGSGEKHGWAAGSAQTDAKRNC